MAANQQGQECCHYPVLPFYATGMDASDTVLHTSTLDKGGKVKQKLSTMFFTQATSDSSFVDFLGAGWLAIAEGNFKRNMCMLIQIFFPAFESLTLCLCILHSIPHGTAWNGVILKRSHEYIFDT